MATYIDKIESLNEVLKTLQPLKPEDQRRLDEKLRLEFNYNSNHLEGNTLTYGETKLLLIFDKTEGKHETREIEEMKAHDVAFTLIKEWAADGERPLNETDIKNLNKIILVKPFYKDAVTDTGNTTRRLISIGNYKQHPNSVQLQSGELFHYASPQETPIKMGELLAWYRQAEEENFLHPVQLAAKLHYEFVLIHPFDDGNGRLSRLLMNYVLFKNNLPPIVIKSNDKKNYLFALNQADTGNFEAFAEYIGQQLIDNLEMTIKAAKGESIEEEDDWEKKLKLVKQKLAGGAEKIELEKSDKTLQIFFEKTAIPFLKAWEEKLRSIDPLFIKRENHIRYSGVGVGGSDFNTAIDYIMNKNKVYFMGLIAAKEPLEISTYFTGVRNKDNRINFNGGEIKIEFFKTSYEILYTGSNKPINKLYSQNLTEEEITKIVNSIGSWFINGFEKYLNDN